MARLGVPLVAIVALSALAVAPAPAYDAWSWLLWGRELTEGTLSTAEGPAFKPLPVAVTALLAPLGEAAPVVWVLLVRLAAAAAAVLAFGWGRRLTGSVAGGVLCAAAVLLCAGMPTLIATGAETAPLLALALAAAEAWRRERYGWALAFGTGCALLRVEAWPFLLVAGLVLWRRAPQLRPALVAFAAGVPALWLVPEWIGSGDVVRSGERARVPNPGQPALADVPFLASLEDAASLPLWPAWLGAAALLVARRRHPATAAVLAGLAWIVLVALMAEAGFSGERRYALPGAALLTAGGLAGLMLVARTRAAAIAVCVVVAIAAAPRLIDLADLRTAQDHQWALQRDLKRAIDNAGGRDAVLACGTPYVGRYRGPTLAYALHVEKRRVEPDGPPRSPGVVFRTKLNPDAAPAPAIPEGFSPSVRTGTWVVATRCAG